MSVVGIVLAAGAGTRYGHPKALATDADGRGWIARAVETLTDAGCAPVLVVLGARHDEATALVPAAATIVVAADWSEGLSASVRAGLAVAAETAATAALMVPVDVPELPASACIRVSADASAETLRQAAYGGEVGHPALIGRAHWSALAAELAGDRGAGGYLRAHGAALVECGDLWHGRDVDAPPPSPSACRPAPAGTTGGSRGRVRGWAGPSPSLLAPDPAV